MVCIKLIFEKPLYLLNKFLHLFRYGRKNTLFASWVTVTTAAFGSSFVKHYWIFFLMRFFIGVFAGGYSVNSKVIAAELVGPKYRSLVTTSLNCIYSISLILLALQAWALPNWTHLQMVASIPYIIGIAGYW